MFESWNVKNYYQNDSEFIEDHNWNHITGLWVRVSLINLNNGIVRKDVEFQDTKW